MDTMGIQWRGAAALVGEKSEEVTWHLEYEISSEEVTISWSHAYAREGILGKRFSLKKGTEVGEQRISWEWRRDGMTCQSTGSMRTFMGIKTSCRKKRPAH